MVTESGIVSDSIGFLPNEVAGTVVIVSGKVNVCIPAFTNPSQPILLSELGNVKFDIALFLKAYFPIVSNPSGNTTDVKFLL